MRYALIPPRSSSMSEVSAYLRALLRDRETRPPSLDLLESPRTILGGLDAFRVARLLGAPRPPHLGSLLEAILEIETSHLLADARLRRIWALAFQLEESAPAERERREQKRKELHSELDARILLDQRGLDTVLAALLLEPEETLAQAALLLDLAVMACDPLAAASILAYGADRLATAYPSRMETWIEFFRSMTPKSLPFGWLSAAVEDFEVAGLLAALVLEHYQIARLDGE